MSDQSLDLEDVDAFTTGAVGRPGQRTFYLQVRKGRQVVTVKLEKQQVSVLASSLARLLDDLPAPTDAPLPTAMELIDPVDPWFVVGRMVLGYDANNDRLMIQLMELLDTDIGDEEQDEADALAERATLRFTFNRGQARSFAAFAEDVVSAGRPSCRFCGGPIDPDGHACPRMN